MSGHGHVVPHADGSKARCGGPAICSACAIELAVVSGGSKPPGDASYTQAELFSVGYAPGRYTSTCFVCSQMMQDVDKRCHVCLECANKRLVARQNRSDPA